MERIENTEYDEAIYYHFQDLIPAGERMSRLRMES